MKTSVDMAGVLDSVVLLHPEETAATIDSGNGVDISQFIGNLKVIMMVGDDSGTDPTLAAKIEHSDSESSGFTDAPNGAFEEIDGSDDDSHQAIMLDTRALKKYIRFVGTLGGSSDPKFFLSVVAVGQKQY